MKFEGTERYVATDDLRMAVNAAVELERPLLIKGEPGTGKTMLAEEVALGLGKRLMADLVRFARERGKDGIGLIVIQTNLRAQALYEAFGFVKTGVHHGNDGQDYFTMRLALDALPEE